jgi:hypothetical protein
MWLHPCEHAVVCILACRRGHARMFNSCVHLGMQLCACEHAVVCMEHQLWACEHVAACMWPIPCSWKHASVQLCALSPQACSCGHVNNEHAVVACIWDCSSVHLSLQFCACEHHVVCMASCNSVHVSMLLGHMSIHTVVCLLGFLERFPNQSSLPGFASTLSNVKESLPS